MCVEIVLMGLVSGYGFFGFLGSTLGLAEKPLQSQPRNFSLFPGSDAQLSIGFVRQPLP
jgi:hypothetical protein